MTKSITSLLALAVTTSLAFANGGGGEDEKKKNPYQGGMAWKPGSGVMLADSDEFSLKLKNRVQVGYSYESNDGAPNVNSFDVRRARIALSGHVLNRSMMYKLQIDATDRGLNATTKDAWAQWNFMDDDAGHIGLRMGQGKPYFGLESTGTSGALVFAERSASTRAFSDIRSTGAFLHGSASENSVRWSAGLQNGTVAGGSIFGILVEEAANQDNELNLVAGVSWDPMGDIMGGRDGASFMQGDLARDGETKGTVGLGVAIGNNGIAGGPDIESTSINVNTAWRMGNGLSLQGEAYSRSDEDANDANSEEDSSGFYAAAHYALEKSADSQVQWGFGVRYDVIQLDAASGGGTTVDFMNRTALGSDSGDVSEISAVINAFYAGHAAKTQIEFTVQDVTPDGGAASTTNNLVRVMFTLAF